MSACTATDNAMQNIYTHGYMYELTQIEFAMEIQRNITY